MSGSRSKWCRRYVNENIELSEGMFALKVDELSERQNVKSKLTKLHRQKKHGFKREPINEKLTRLWKKHRFPDKKKKVAEKVA